MRRKNYLAIRMRKQLELASEKAGPGVPLKVSVAYYAQMRSNIKADLTFESRVEYLREGWLCNWKGRKVFVTPDAVDEPLPYPQGTGIIKEMDDKRRGRC